MTIANAKLGKIVDRLRQATLSCCSTPDRDLLQRYITLGDEAAFAVLVKRYGPMVLGLCWRILRQREDAEDAFQAVFLVLARKAGRIRQRESLAGWLHRVAYRAAMKLRGVNARRTARNLPLADHSLAGRAEDATLWETQQTLESELERLPDKYRAPLLLCCVQGRTRDEAARQLGWSLGVLRGRLDRGRELLRARLARRGIALSMALLPLGVAATSEAAVPPALFATVRAAAGAAHSSAAAAVSAQAAALAQGVIQAMFMTKVKICATGLLVLAFLGAGAGVVTYRAQAQVPAPPDNVIQTAPAADDPAPKREMDPAELRREIQRLRLELEQTRLLLKLANQEILKLRAIQERRVRERQAGTAPGVPIDGQPVPEKPKTSPLPIQPGADGSKKAPGSTRQEAVSPDQKTIAVAQGKSIRFFDVATGKEIRRLQGHVETVNAVAFSPTGKVLASGGKDQAVVLWDQATGKMLSKVAVQNPVITLIFAPDGSALTIRLMDQSTIEIDVPTGKIIRTKK